MTLGHVLPRKCAAHQLSRVAPMIRTVSLLCCVTVLGFTAACGKKTEAPRTNTFLDVAPPEKISDLTLPGLARSAGGELFLTLFIHSGFPSATDAHDAVAVLKSADNGATWPEAGKIPSHVTYGVWGFDSAIGENDALYMTWTASLRKEDSPAPFKAVMFSRSNDGGRTWTAPVPVSSATTGQRRQPSIALSGDGVHIAWLDESRRGAAGPHPPADVYVATSPDGGVTWGENVCLETDLNNKVSSSGAPSLCVGEDGAVYCAYFSLRRGTNGGFWIANSTDGGRTFTVTPHTKDALGSVCLTESDGMLFLAAVHIKSIRSISMQNPQTCQEIRFHASDDGGKTWTKAVLVDDDPDDRHKSNVKLAAIGGNRLIACWHDERGGVYMVASLDGGKTWGKNLRVANASRVGITPIAVAADKAAGTFYLTISDVRKGGGDATFFMKGSVNENAP